MCLDMGNRNFKANFTLEQRNTLESRIGKKDPDDIENKSANQKDDDRSHTLKDLKKKNNLYTVKAAAKFEFSAPGDIPFYAVFKGFVKDTTFHGLPHVVNAKGTIKKVFYGLVTLVTYCMLVYNLHLIFDSYFSYDINTEIALVKNDIIDFPAVSICNINYARVGMLPPNLMSEVNQSLQVKLATKRPSRKSGLSSSTFFDHRSIYLEHLQRIPKDEMTKIGHQLDDMVLHAEYDGYEQPFREFDHFSSPHYGNCYTFNSGKNHKPLVTARPGVEQGLRLYLNIEQWEYNGAITDKSGIRVLIHDQSHPPLPELFGFNISPGFATSVSIQKEAVERKLVGNRICYDTKIRDQKVDAYLHENLFPYANYTVSTCIYSCYQRKLNKECGCFHTLLPIMPHKPGRPVLLSCSSEELNQNQSDCLRQAQIQHREGKLDCEMCLTPCKEISFLQTISNTQWPSLNFESTARDLIKSSLISKNKSLSPLLDPSTSLRDNVVALDVYYEVLYQKTVIETPSYTMSQFVSDVGGLLGLCLGASIISIYEFVEFISDISALVCCKVGKVLTKTDIRERKETNVPIS